MFQEERLIEIMSILSAKKRISIEEICETFNVSRDTARRDLVKLDEQGQIVRTRGGALQPTQHLLHSYEDRKNAHPKSKHRIGMAAVNLIRNEEQILLDSSTTVQSMVEYWKSFNNRVVTNSVYIASLMAGQHNCEVHLLGGIIHPTQRFIYGAKTLESLNQLYFQKLFLGACGVTKNGLSNPYEEESTLIKSMINRAEQVIVLADSTKFHQQLFHHVCSLESIDIIITDQQPNQMFQELLTQLDIQIVVAKGDEKDD